MKICFFTVLVCLCFAIRAEAQESNGEGAESRLLKVTLAKADADGNIVEDPEHFSPKDIPIHVYVDLVDDNPADFKLQYVAVKAKGVRPNTVMVTLQHKSKQGETGASFHAKPNGRWAEGDYRVDVFIDGKLVEKREFKVSP